MTGTDMNIGSLVSSLPLPPPLHQPTHHGEEGGDVADHPNQSPNVCWCGAAFGRRADLERHQRTTRKHNGDYRSVSTAILYSQITCINAPELELYYHYKS